MKNLFALLLAVFISLGTAHAGGSGIISGNVFNAGAVSPGLLVTIEFYDTPTISPGGLVYSDTTRVDSNGFYSLPYSFIAGGTFGIANAYITDCRLNMVSDTMSWDTSAFGSNPVIDLDYCPPCTASFQDSLRFGYAYTFINRSFPFGPSVSYSWDFGDGSPSSTLHSPSHTYSGPGNYTVCLTLVDSLASCIDTTCISLRVNTFPGGCTPTFTSGTSGFTVTFNNTTSIGTGFTYYWEFGDGDTSRAFSPVHTYNNPGTYQACLYTVDPFNQICDSACATISIGNPPLQITGNVFDSLSGNPGSGIVYLIKTDSVNTLVVQDTLNIGNVVGSSYAFNVTAGTYYVKAALLPNNPNYSNYLPTYYNSSLTWSAATAIVITSASSIGNDIQLIAGLNPGGPGFIGGKVSEGANKTAAPGDPVPNASVILTDVNDRGLRHTVSDADGNYEFANLAYGTYKVFVEIIGKTAYTRTIVLSQSEERIEDADFLVAQDRVSTGLEDISLVELKNLYPNPANEQTNLTVELSSPAVLELQVIDVLGKEMLNRTVSLPQGNHTIDFDLSDFPKGLYFVNLSTTDSRITQRLVKF